MRLSKVAERKLQ